MTRKELLSSPAYWEQQAQLDIYKCAVDFMEKHKMNRKQLAAYLGVSQGYVTQLLSGDYNYSLSKLIDLSLKLGVAPKLEFRPLDKILATDTKVMVSTILHFNQFNSFNITTKHHVS